MSESNRTSTDASAAKRRAALGTYADMRAPRSVMIAFLVIAFALLLVPSAGMTWAATNSTTENRELAPAPTLFDEAGALNVAFLSDAGTYFNDHFAYRNLLVAANARWKALFCVSASDQVVLGTDGWLYYAGTLPDFERTDVLSDRALENIAHNLRMTQDYVEAHDAVFAFTLVPNKNTLFPDNMPYYHLAGEGLSNAERLKPFLEAEQVTYIDLFSFLSTPGKARYLKTDSHWDNATALLAGNELLTAIGYDPVPFDASKAVAREDFVGDLENMLFPAGQQPETNQYFPHVNDGEAPTNLSWGYVSGSSVEDDWIQTESDAPYGNMLVFRDSFGNALLPLWASAIRSVTFSKLVPYNLPIMATVGADAVVIERAERHLGFLADTAPVFPNPTVRGVKWEENDDTPSAGASLSASLDGSYLALRGTIDEHMCESVKRLYVAIEDAEGTMRVYKPFWLRIANEDQTLFNDFGYQVYLPDGESAIKGSRIHVCAFDNEGLAHVDVFEEVSAQ